ncbi:terminase [Bordetella avium]|nr:terminase [Bordetella avium]RIQ16076.1 terminase [Bordetella avium]
MREPTRPTGARAFGDTSKTAPMKKVSTYTEAIATEICDRIADGEPLRQICRDQHMPAWRTVYHWIEARSEFAERMERARRVGFDAIAEEALEIANTPQIGEETEQEGSKFRVKRGDMLGHRKLQVETRLKLLAKWHPTKYGDKTSMELTGAGGGPVRIDETQAAARLCALAAIARARRVSQEADDPTGGLV